MAKNSGISLPVVKRLPRYYSNLEELKREGVLRISSSELAGRMKLTASQIRQDLNHFGGFGQQGYGYNVSDLYNEIGHILGVEQRLKVILIGVGNIGKAIATQVNFSKRGCELIGLFDIDNKLVGQDIAGMKVCDMTELSYFCKTHKPEIAILCIPKSQAYGVAERLIGAGVTSFWNFSHFDLNVHFDGIIVENVHLGDSLMTLKYRTNNKL